MNSSPIRVVLCRSIYPRNVGMCARAMANMGVDQLILISPRCAISDENAKQGAAHAQSVLQNARVYQSLSEFCDHEGEGLRIGLSAKDGRLQQTSGLEQRLSQYLADPEHPFRDPSTPTWLFFGPEDDGLASDEIELCHHICRLPTHGEITSLNLSHAVLLALHVVVSARLELTPMLKAPIENTAEKPRQFASGPIYYPKETIHRWLEKLGFDLSSPKINIEKTLNRIFLSNTPSPDELRILDTVLQQTLRRIKTKEGQP